MSVPANFFDTYAVVASPTDDTETVIAILGGVGELLPGLSVHFDALVQIEPDADVTAFKLAIRRADINGDEVGPGGAVQFDPAGTFGTGQVAYQTVDFPGDFAGAVYVLTLICTAAGGASDVDFVHFGARTC